MKKLSAILCLLGFSISLWAQQPVNPGFETWVTSNLYENPDSFTTTNTWTFATIPGGNATKITGAYHGLYATQLTTIPVPNDTIFGALFIGVPSPGGIAGGLPYSGQPDSISFYAKYNVPLNDTAFFMVGFKSGGNIISIAQRAIIGVQNTWQRICIPSGLPLTPVPDTIVAVITSSRMDPPRIAGSTLTVDSITMIGTTQLFPNYSFEDWTPFTSEEPVGWTTINYAVIPGNPMSATKSTTSQNGSFAMRLENVATTWGDTAGYITNGYIGMNGPAGGMHVNNNPQKLTGYYEYFPVGPDTALGALFTFRNGLPVDSVFIDLPAQSIYTYFEMSLNYHAWPVVDTLNIAFASGNINDSTSFVGLGSVLYIDNLNITYYPAGIQSEYINEPHSIYPNPFTDAAILQFTNMRGVIYTVAIYDVLGNEVMKIENISSNGVTINRNHLPAGIYEYRVNSTVGNNFIARGKLVMK